MREEKFVIDFDYFDYQAITDAFNEFRLRIHEAGMAIAEAVIASGLVEEDCVCVFDDETGGALIEELIPEAVAEWKAVRDAE